MSRPTLVMRRLWTKTPASGFQSSAFSAARLLIPSPFIQNRLCELVDRGEQGESNRNTVFPSSGETDRQSAIPVRAVHTEVLGPEEYWRCGSTWRDLACRTSRS